MKKLVFYYLSSLIQQYFCRFLYQKDKGKRQCELSFFNSVGFMLKYSRIYFDSVGCTLKYNRISKEKFEYNYEFV